jgi:hypothetical protein
VESPCECGNELSGSIKCWELPSGYTTCGLSSRAQLHRVSFFSWHEKILEDSVCHYLSVANIGHSKPFIAHLVQKNVFFPILLTPIGSLRVPNQTAHLLHLCHIPRVEAG